jgi:hypothetical protein
MATMAAIFKPLVALWSYEAWKVGAGPSPWPPRSPDLHTPMDLRSQREQISELSCSTHEKIRILCYRCWVTNGALIGHLCTSFMRFLDAYKLFHVLTRKM